jgi:4-hydroxythreonine-4-phosphate dehydrogenase
MAFDHAVNTTIGLPFVRTSPDHGTAFGIAELGIADARSMKAAIITAAQMVQQRKRGAAATAAAVKQPVGSSKHRAAP